MSWSDDPSQVDSLTLLANIERVLKPLERQDEDIETALIGLAELQHREKAARTTLTKVDEFHERFVRHLARALEAGNRRAVRRNLYHIADILGAIQDDLTRGPDL